jgi:hypothetical protein
MRRSGDRKGEFTAETRRRGENQKPTTEARRHGEESGDRVIARDRVIGKTRAFFSTVRGALREIFDESAYDRFLLRTNAKRSVASYCDFTRERDASMLKKPRCC